MSKTAAEVDVDSMSIKAMKALIESVGMPHADCVEKSDLRARCREALARRGEAERGPSPAERAPSPTAATGAPEEKLMDWQVKQREYEVKKARAKALKLRLTCTICGEKAKLNCPCGTTQCDPGARVGGGALAPRDASRGAVTRDPTGTARPNVNASTGATAATERPARRSATSGPRRRRGRKRRHLRRRPRPRWSTAPRRGRMPTRSARASPPNTRRLVCGARRTRSRSQ